MRKQLESALILAAKALKYGVMDVDPIRAKSYGVNSAVYVNQGQYIPHNGKIAGAAGYYVLGANKTLKIHSSPTGKKTYYYLIILSDNTTGEENFKYNAFTYSEMLAYLRGISDGIYERDIRHRGLT